MSVPDQPEEAEVPFTRILERAVRGEDEAVQHVLPRVYQQLVDIARSAMRRERGDHTLQATALVHECWMKLLGEHSPSFDGRGEFYRAAAEAMRRILVDHARRRARIKRGGDRERVSITTIEPAITEDPDRFLALDEAIRRLEAEDPRAAEIVRLRFFAGLSVEETADAIGLSRRTVLREWAYARALLYRELEGEPPPDSA
jgi:RNA polymerase sigma factor (TIGR02999 family)